MRTFLNYIPLLALAIIVAVAFSIDLAPGAMTTSTIMNTDLLTGLGFAGLIVNKANLNIVFTAFKTAFTNAFKNADKQWDKIATLVPSTTKEEKYGWLGQFPRLREWVGDRHVKSLELHDYSIKNKSFESTIGVPKEDVEDDSFGLLTPLVADMGYSAQTHPDELLFALLAAGFTTNCYDGQYFFDTDHPVKGASVSNMQVGASAPWFLLDTSRPLKPLIFQKRKDYNFQAMISDDDEKVFMAKEFRFGIDARVNVGFAFWQMAFGSLAALDETNYNAAIAAMMSFKSDEDKPLGVRPTILVTGPSNRAAGQAIIEAQLKANGASNTNYKSVELMVVPWLA